MGGATKHGYFSGEVNGACKQLGGGDSCLCLCHVIPRDKEIHVDGKMFGIVGMNKSYSYMCVLLHGGKWIHILILKGGMVHWVDPVWGGGLVRWIYPIWVW